MRQFITQLWNCNYELQRPPSPEARDAKTATIRSKPRLVREGERLWVPECLHSCRLLCGVNIEDRRGLPADGACILLGEGGDILAVAGSHGLTGAAGIAVDMVDGREVFNFCINRLDGRIRSLVFVAVPRSGKWKPLAEQEADDAPQVPGDEQKPEESTVFIGRSAEEREGTTMQMLARMRCHPPRDGSCGIFVLWAIHGTPTSAGGGLRFQVEALGKLLLMHVADVSRPLLGNLFELQPAINGLLPLARRPVSASRPRDEIPALLFGTARLDAPAHQRYDDSGMEREVVELGSVPGYEDMMEAMLAASRFAGGMCIELKQLAERNEQLQEKLSSRRMWQGRAMGIAQAKMYRFREWIREVKLAHVSGSHSVVAELIEALPLEVGFDPEDTDRKVETDAVAESVPQIAKQAAPVAPLRGLFLQATAPKLVISPMPAAEQESTHAQSTDTARSDGASPSASSESGANDEDARGGAAASAAIHGGRIQIGFGGMMGQVASNGSQPETGRGSVHSNKSGTVSQGSQGRSSQSRADTQRSMDVVVPAGRPDSSASGVPPVAVGPGGAGGSGITLGTRGIGMAGSGGRGPEAEEHEEALEAVVHWNEVANQAAERGDIPRQREALEEVVSILTAKFGEEHKQVAATLVQLGTLYGAMGDNVKKKETLEHALEIMERTYGPGSAQVAVAKTRLGNAVRDLGDPKRCIELVEPNIGVLMDQVGEDHPEVSAALTSLGNGYGALGQYDRQKDYLEQALAIKERVDGPQAASLAITLQHLADCYHSLKRADDQARCLERALEVKEANFGPDHPKVALTLASLGLAAKRRGNNKKAKEYYERALHIKEKAYGPEHQQVAPTLANLGTIYAALGDKVREVEVLERSLRIFEKTLGEGSQQAQLTRKLLAQAKGPEPSGGPDADEEHGA